MSRPNNHQNEVNENGNSFTDTIFSWAFFTDFISVVHINMEKVTHIRTLDSQGYLTARTLYIQRTDDSTHAAIT